MRTRAIGRPRGARTANRIVINVDLSQCPVCGSYTRTAYKNKRPVFVGRSSHNGRAYSWILQRDTTCKCCGQARTDQSFVYQMGSEN